MAGKRASKPPTKRTVTAAAAKKQKKTKAGSVAAATAAALSDDKKKLYHILNLVPIKRAEYIALLHAKGVECDEACDDPRNDVKIKRDPITLELPLNCERIADDFIDDYYSDDENTSKKPNTVRYHCPITAPAMRRINYAYKYAVVMKLGRPQMCDINKVSRELCYIGLTNNGDAWIEMCQKPCDHLVHVDGKVIQKSKGKHFSLHNGSVLSFFQHKIGLTYRVEIESSVLANREHRLSRLDGVIAKYNMCCACRDPYDPVNEARLPIRGVCGHHLCEECLDMYHSSQVQGKRNLRYIKCPICNCEKSFDVQNKVKDRLFCDLLKEGTLESNSEVANQATEKSAADADRLLQLSSEVAMLRKKIEEIEQEKTRLRKRNEELEKRNEELESKPEAAGRETEETDDSDVEVVEVDVLPEPARKQEYDSASNSTPDTAEKQVSPPTQPKEWACTRCTFLNPMTRKTCKMQCGGKRKGP